MTLRPITNRKADGRFELPADGWFQLAPLGEFPHPESGLVQVLDRPALERMANRLAADGARLVDFDHFSYDTSRSSEAAGWIEELAVRDDGLWARARWSDVGEAALVNGRYRFVSPVWLPGDCDSLGANRIRPGRLDSAGLTNQPNLRGMAPMTNRAGGPAAPTPTSEPKSMKTVANRLGLSPDASEEAVLAEVNKLLKTRDDALAQVEPLKNRVKDLETGLQASKAAQADADMETFADVIPETARDAWKAQLIANRDGTIALLKGIQERAKAAPAAPGRSAPVLQNRHPGKEKQSGQATDPAALAREQAQAIDEYRIANRCTYMTAREHIRLRRPELFEPAQQPAK